LSKIINGTQVLPNLKKAEGLQPDSSAVSFGLGSFYFLAPIIAGGNRQKAKEYLEKTIETDPLFADAYIRLAQLYKMLGDEKTSKDYLNKALDIDPQNTLVQDFRSGRCKFACISVEE
jgi:Tfp pilus assembly protein PilF